MATATKTLGRPVGTRHSPDARPQTAATYELPPFDEWAEANLIQSTDIWAGKPLSLEPWQRTFMRQATEMDGREFLWRSAVLVLPRKNGKTTMLAAYALYRLFDSGQPEILLAASSDKQAGRLFDAVVSFLYRNPALFELVAISQHVGEIARKDGGGKIIRLASDPSTLHGYNPSLVICDELHAWTKPSQRKAWAALTTAGGARERTQTFTITTAGEASERTTGILGQLIDRNEREGETERSDDYSLTISRNPEARLLCWNFCALTTDASDTAALERANPASWVTREYLERQAANLELSPAEVLQLHGCVWAEGIHSWIPAEAWERCYEATAVIPEDAELYVGVDVGLVHDSTAVSLAWKRDDERVLVDCQVWSADPKAAAHTHVPGGVIDLEAVETYILSLAERFRVLEVLYDPRFFERSAQILSDAGLMVVPLHQSSAPMADAYQGWYAALLEGRVVHSGDRVLTAHVMATAAQKSDRGWKISKIRNSQRIDACVASAMAHYGAVSAPVADWGVL